jgi:hypothetical protein
MWNGTIWCNGGMQNIQTCTKSAWTASVLFKILNWRTRFYRRQISEHVLHIQWNNQNNICLWKLQIRRRTQMAHAHKTINDVHDEMTPASFYLKVSLGSKVSPDHVTIWYDNARRNRSPFSHSTFRREETFQFCWWLLC